MVNEMKKEEKEVERCEFCEETFETAEKLTLHVNHAHYRDTYKAVDRERRNWAKQCLARLVLILKRNEKKCNFRFAARGSTGGSRWGGKSWSR